MVAAPAGDDGWIAPPRLCDPPVYVATLLRPASGGVAVVRPRARRDTEDVRTKERIDVISHEPRKSWHRRWLRMGVLLVVAAAVATSFVQTNRHRTGAAVHRTPTHATPGSDRPEPSANACGQVPFCVAATVGITPALARPLSLPRLAPGASCPVSAGQPPPDGWPSGGTAHRVGPMSFMDARTPNGLARRSMVLFDPGDWTYIQNRWFGFATIVLADPGYRGPVLIRARQLDGGYPVGFGFQTVIGSRNATLAHALILANGLRDWAGISWLRSPGCYAWQLDGPDFSGVIVLKAVANPAGH